MKNFPLSLTHSPLSPHLPPSFSSISLSASFKKIGKLTDFSSTASCEKCLNLTFTFLYSAVGVKNVFTFALCFQNKLTFHTDTIRC